jgi:hypothetical protein
MESQPVGDGKFGNDLKMMTTIFGIAAGHPIIGDNECVFRQRTVLYIHR